jgi:hypothetical protein
VAAASPSVLILTPFLRETIEGETRWRVKRLDEIRCLHRAGLDMAILDIFPGRRPISAITVMQSNSSIAEDRGGGLMNEPSPHPQDDAVNFTK